MTDMKYNAAYPPPGSHTRLLVLVVVAACITEPQSALCNELQFPLHFPFSLWVTE